MQMGLKLEGKLIVSCLRRLHLNLIGSDIFGAIFSSLPLVHKRSTNTSISVKCSSVLFLQIILSK